MQAFVQLRRGSPGPLPPPVEGFENQLSVLERAEMDRILSCSVAGSPQTVRRGLEDFIARHAPDELMVTAQIFDPAARLRSYEITAEVRSELAREGASVRSLPA